MKKRIVKRQREGESFRMCGGKRKLKSSKAGRLAGKLGQRKYSCPICGGWHLTTKEKRF